MSPLLLLAGIAVAMAIIGGAAWLAVKHGYDKRQLEEVEESVKQIKKNREAYEAIQRDRPLSGRDAIDRLRAEGKIK